MGLAVEFFQLGDNNVINVYFGRGWLLETVRVSDFAIVILLPYHNANGVFFYSRQLRRQEALSSNASAAIQRKHPVPL